LSLGVVGVHADATPAARGGWTTEKAGNAPVETATLSAKQKKQKANAEAVWATIMQNADIVPGKNWPENLDTTIVFKVVDSIQIGKHVTQHNAVASKLLDDNGQPVMKDGKFVPLVRITWGYIDLLGDDEHGIALVLTHELGHHALGHTVGPIVLKPNALALADSHRREADADLYGARLMLKAGYSLRQGVKAEWIGLDAQGWTHSAAGGTCASHPGSSDRAARLFAILDKGEAQLWKCMSSFENGVTFLRIANYAAAEECFLRVTQEFPNCHEAWANLGLARLMRYCQTLSTRDLQQLGIGHFLASTHYPTAPSLLRSGSDKLWYEAVNALKKAKDLKPASPLVLANFGLAYLVSPAGKDVGAALEYFTQAEAAFGLAQDMPEALRLTLLVNFGVAALADGDTAKGRERLMAAAKLAKGVYGDRKQWPAVVREAITFNTALAQTDEEKAIAMYEEYLAGAARSSVWWTTAYDHYATLCQNLSRKPVAKETLGQKATLLKQLVVTLADGKTVHVGESLEDVIAKLGKPTQIRKERSSVRRLVFEKHGIELLADAEEVFAIVITSPKGLSIEIREVGLAGKKHGELKVGMSQKQVETLLGQGELLSYLFLSKEYPYYAELGVAVEYTDDVVSRVIVGQFPGGNGVYD
jgi:tetratricopeptide (TPR) repeat protein